MSRQATQKGLLTHDKPPEPKPQEHVGSSSPRSSISWAEAVHGSPSIDQQTEVPRDRNSPRLESRQQMQMMIIHMMQRMALMQESQDTFCRQMQHIQEHNRVLTGEMQSKIDNMDAELSRLATMALVKSMCLLCPLLSSKFERLGFNRLQAYNLTKDNKCWR
jgi:hypothetical protein